MVPNEISEDAAYKTISFISSKGFTEVKEPFKLRKYRKKLFKKILPETKKTLFISFSSKLRKGQEIYHICFWAKKDDQKWYDVSERNFDSATSIYDLGRLCEFAEKEN